MQKIIFNGKVYVNRDRFETAILIKDGVIQKVGKDAEILAKADASTEKIDAKGRTILPGMNDSHQHLYSIGLQQGICDLSTARSMADIIRLGSEFAAENPELIEVVLEGVSYNQDYFADGKRVPNRHDLDKISTDIPIIFTRVCGHVVSTNTKAIEMAELTKDSPQVEGGVFEVEADGYPNGVFNENARNLVRKLIPVKTEAEMMLFYEKAMDYVTSQGITSVQSTDARQNNYKEIFSLLHKMYDADKLRVRFRHQFSLDEPNAFRDFLETEFLDPRYKENKRLTLGTLKVFKDGSLGGRTSYMREDFKDDPGNKGVPILTVEEMDVLCQLAEKNGVQVAAHVIGDKAIEETLDSYEKALEGRENKHRHALVHVQITDTLLLERIANLDILSMVQPIFLNYDLHIVEDRVGKELAKTSYAFHTMDKLGIHVAYGTDAPIEDPNPFECIYAAVARKDLSGYPPGGFYPEESVDIFQAIDNYTIGSAYVESLETVKGRLDEGYYADLIILNEDIFTIDPEKIKDITVGMTMVDGKIVYEA